MSVFALFAAGILGAFTTHAAVFETYPRMLNEASKDVKITFHADQSGVAALQGLTEDLYAHIGVHTTTYPSGDWAHVKTAWGTNTDETRLVNKGNDTYEMTIPDIRSYFGITNESETVTEICILARKANKSAQTSDCFLKVYSSFSMEIESDPASTIIYSPQNVTVSAYTTAPATITISYGGEVIKSAENATELSATQYVSTPGQNKFTLKSTDGTKNSSKVIVYKLIEPSASKEYPGGVPKQGAVKNADGTVTFCLAAPTRGKVSIVGSWSGYTEEPMYCHNYKGYNYFWTTVSGLDNTSWYPYYYRVDENYNCGDPYAKLVLDANSDPYLPNDGNAWPLPDRPAYPSEVTNKVLLACYKGDFDDYNWQVKDFQLPDYKALSIYEICVRDFSGTSKKADGSIHGVIEKLDYIRSLGVNAIELMPIQNFDGNNSWGYSTNAYMAPDKAYGSPDDYRELIDECHKRGIAVILDIVFNHTTGQHPWYTMYGGKANNPYYNVTAPHNFSVYEDIAQEYPLVEQHWVDVLKHWLVNYKVDGFRFDLVKGLGDSDSYSGNYDVGSSNSTIVDRMKRLHAAMKEVKPNVIHINEYLGNLTDEKNMGNDGQLQWNNQNTNARNYAKCSNGNLIYLNSAKCSRPTCSTVDYLESHDEPWIGYSAATATNSSLKDQPKNQRDRLAAAGVQMLMSPGPKMIWQFGELGYDENLTESNRTSPKPLHWEYLEDEYRANIFETYRAMNWLRRNNPELFNETATVYYDSFSSTNKPRAMCVINGEKEVIALINSSTAEAEVACPSSQKVRPTNCQLVCASYDFAPTLAVNSDGKPAVTIPAHGFAVFATKTVTEVENVIADGITSNARVYGGNGEIIIDGDYESLGIYTLSGQRMASTKVPAGLYLVIIDGQTTKVVVR